MERKTKKSMGLTALLLALTLGIAPGCDVELDGDEGNFTFRYLESERDVASDLAVGARVDIEVRDAETEAVLALDQVYSEDSQVIEVVDEQARQFTLEAVSAGRARIGADATVHGEELSDSVEIRSAEVGEVELSDKCSDGVFLTDNRLRAGYHMRDAAGGRLTGYGHYPVSVEPAEGGTVNEEIRFLGSLEILTGSEPGTFEIVPDVDGGSLSFELIAAADVDELDLVTDHESTAPVVNVGHSEAAVVYGLQAGGRTVCGPLDTSVEITSETPEICQAEPGLFFGELDVLSMHTVVVEGLEAGDCEITLSVVDTDLSETFQVEIRD